MIFLHELPHRDAQKLLKSGAPVYLGFNPVEYHGPHLPLSCDRLIGQGVLMDFTTRMSARFEDWPILVANDVDCGVEPTSGPGSRHQSYATLRKIVRESCRALLELGAKRIVLHTFHGSVMHNLALEDGVQLCRKEGAQALAPFHVVLDEMVNLDPSQYAPAFDHIEDPDERRAMIDGLSMDFHAGFFETSLALHYAQDSVSPRYAEMPPCPPFDRDPSLAALSKVAHRLGKERLSREMSFAADALGWPKLRPFPGYTGRPHRARAESGAFFANHLLDRYEQAAVRVFNDHEPPPAPIMRWLKVLTFHGAIEATKVPIEDVAPDPLE